MFYIHQKRNPIQLVIQFHLSSIQMMIHPCTKSSVTHTRHLALQQYFSYSRFTCLVMLNPTHTQHLALQQYFSHSRFSCLEMLSPTHTRHLALQQYFSHSRFTCLVMLSLTTHKHELETIKRSETTETHHVELTTWQSKVDDSMMM
jgi:hypothetical protein